MTLSVSVPQREVELLDADVAQHGLASRSAAVQHAIRALRRDELMQDYVEAFAEWDGSEEAQLWDGVVADGVSDAAG